MAPPPRRCGCRSSAASSRSASRSRSASARSRSRRTTPSPRRARPTPTSSRPRSAAGRCSSPSRSRSASRSPCSRSAPALLADLLPISNGTLFVLVEGLIRVTIFVAYLALLTPDPVAAARLRVPRRRAQGDQRLRGRRGADPRDRPALLADPPALRHLVPVLGRRAERVRLRALRPAALVRGSSSRGSPSCP